MKKRATTDTTERFSHHRPCFIEPKEGEIILQFYESYHISILCKILLNITNLNSVSFQFDFP